MANGEARRVIALLARDPEAAKMMVSGTYGYRIVPEELWIESLGRWVRADGSTISGGLMGYLYPGPWWAWRLRRAITRWKDKVELPPLCDHPHQSDVHWSQDGFVSMCKVCDRIVYHGD